MIKEILLMLTVASWIYWLVALWLVYAFFRSKEELDTSFNPPVSILKPVKGLDAEAYENFASFCKQNYPCFELLFGVVSPDDPVIPVIEGLCEDFPEIDIRLVIGPVSGTNRKAALLHKLANRARFDVLVVSDSDMRVTPDYLHRVVAPLADPQTGLVTCPYRGENPTTFTARLEALYMGVSFLPSVLVARKFLNMRFAMGATNVLRRKDLARLGGFAAISDYLADDYQLGVKISQLGLRVHLSDYVITSILGVTTFQEQWHREVRWAHCNRISRPMEYPGLLLSYSTPLAVILLAVSWFSSLGWLALGISLSLRWVVAWLTAGFTGDYVSRRWLFWLPIRDMFTALVWCAGVIGRHIVWRGETFLLHGDGRLEPVPDNVREVPMILDKIVRKIDATLRDFYNIFDYCQDDDCMLRMSFTNSERDITLSDGTQITKGQKVVELHFWNEHMPQMPKSGPDMAWALAFRRKVIHSLKNLSSYIETNPEMKDISAFFGDPPFSGQESMSPLMEMVRRWGFDVVEKEAPEGIWERFVAFWEKVYTLMLVWVYNPGSLKNKDAWVRNRDELWISRGLLINKYAEKQIRQSQSSEDRRLEPMDVSDLSSRTAP